MEIQSNDPENVVQRLTTELSRSMRDPRPIVVLMCGLAGAGKTTLAKEILKEHPNFRRLSNDEIIASHHGICGVDYDVSRYDMYQEEADGVFMRDFQQLLAAGQVDVVLDRSFYAKEDRDEFKALAEAAGARWLLIHIRLDETSLWRRVVERRRKGVDANSALEISRVVFDKYVEGFEHPCGEGEIVVEYTAERRR